MPPENTPEDQVETTESVVEPQSAGAPQSLAPTEGLETATVNPPSPPSGQENEGTEAPADVAPVTEPTITVPETPDEPDFDWGAWDGKVESAPASSRAWLKHVAAYYGEQLKAKDAEFEAAKERHLDEITKGIADPTLSREYRDLERRHRETEEAAAALQKKIDEGTASRSEIEATLKALQEDNEKLRQEYETYQQDVDKREVKRLIRNNEEFFADEGNQQKFFAIVDLFGEGRDDGQAPQISHEDAIDIIGNPGYDKYREQILEGLKAGMTWANFKRFSLPHIQAQKPKKKKPSKGASLTSGSTSSPTSPAGPVNLNSPNKGAHEKWREALAKTGLPLV